MITKRSAFLTKIALVRSNNRLSVRREQRWVTSVACPHKPQTQQCPVKESSVNSTCREFFGTKFTLEVVNLTLYVLN